MNAAAAPGKQPSEPAGRKKIRPKDGWGTIVKIGAYLGKHRALLVMIIVMTVFSSILGLMGPYLLGWAIDHYFVPGDYAGLAGLIMLLGAFYLLQSLAAWLQNYWMIGVAQEAVSTMRKDLFRQLHRLPVSYYVKRQHGDMMSRVTHDIENVSQTLNTSVIQLLSSLLTFTGMLGLMLWLSPLLTVITLTIIPGMVLGMKWITARTGKYFKEQQRDLGQLNGFVEESLSAHRIVKSFSMEERMIEAFVERSGRLKVSGYWAQTYTGFIPKLMNMLNNVSFAIIAGAGGLLAINGLVSVGILVTFAEYARQFTRPLNDLANQFNTFLSAIAGAERVFAVLEEDGEERDERNAGEIRNIQGDVVLENVSFAYEKGGQTIRDVTIHARPGETVALVGPTGAGKTTIFQLLSRFYDPDEGEIRIDGRPTGTMTRSSLRRQMGFVLQDVFLFEGTIRDNIRYGRLDATDRDVERAARDANAHSFIIKLPHGYDTMLQADGAGISQGQKQLLSIARTLLADPSILLLDEATSSIDTVTEVRIQEALTRLMKGRTSFVIAHRLNTIRQADRIIVLDQGRVIEQGSHAELMEQEGFYYELNKGLREHAAQP
ncbi:multidrug ABC transporter ATP-binding protein [Paenibacillus sambharensis]|uniref:Multidrug ABC transporter ATP-binding protein n=2 Tax=Paenibacillus sambharensis TaxID=1803190 RepID=A0A2W1LFT9_9BACL|nr:ABC transporter ATP-binding protein [Paenibacillus sambharensis]PZD97693.1 multidrug ABC transporter ATP-binding protein [Paenibacillus sambharensis]